MKTKIKTYAIILLMIIASVISTGKTSAQQAYVSFQVFYDQLSPYGDWVYSPDYDYIWIPDAGPDFFPYSTQGHWVLTNYGWTWVSSYEWGWAPFHYGRWDYNNYYGWFWIPGNEWGPAWVSWRRAEGYYGWEPMGPHITINMNFGGQYDYTRDHWVFVRDRDFNRTDINRYSVNRGDYDRIIRSSQVINNTYVDKRRNTTFVTGPSREDIQRVTGSRINPVPVREYNKPGHDTGNDHVSLYMPEVARNNGNERWSEPSRITKLNEVKRPSERKVSNRPDYPMKNQNNTESAQPKKTAPVQNSGREQQQKTNPQQNASRREQQNAPSQQKPAQQQIAPPQQNPAPQQKPTPQQKPAQHQSPNQQQNATRQEQHTAPPQQKPAQQQNAPPQQKPAQQQNATRRDQQSIPAQQKPTQQQNPVKSTQPTRREGTQKSDDSKVTKEKP